MLGGVGLGEQADEPAERLILFLEWECVHDDDLIGCHIEVSSGERPGLGSGGRLIGSRCGIRVSRPTRYALVGRSGVR